MKETETARQSENDEDDIPFSKLKEKVRSERQGSDSDEDSIPFSQILVQTRIAKPLQDKVQVIKTMSVREADETAKFGEVQTWSDEDEVTEVPLTDILQSLKTPLQETASVGQAEIVEIGVDVLECPEDLVGSKIAPEFGKRGIYLGEVLRIEYDSEDEDKMPS